MPPLAEAVGFGAAIDYITGIGLEAIHEHEAALTAYGWELLSAIPGVTLYGPPPPDRAGILSFTVDGVSTPTTSPRSSTPRACASAPGHHCTQPAMRRFDVDRDGPREPLSLQHHRRSRPARGRHRQGQADVPGVSAGRRRPAARTACRRWTLLAAPELGAADAARVEDERRRLDAPPAMLDGPILMIGPAAPERLAVYPATYAWHTADRVARCPPPPARSACSSPWSATVARSCGSDGADTVDHPGGWTISVAGSAVPGVGLERQVVAEAERGARARPGRSLELATARAGGGPARPHGAGRVPRAARRGAAPDRLREPARSPRCGSLVTSRGWAPAESLTAAWWPELVRLATEDG